MRSNPAVRIRICRVLAELVPKLNQMAQVPLGLVQIGLDQIEGTATKGRTTAFARGFLPLLEQDSEFATKWSILTTALWKTVCVSPSSRWNIIKPLSYGRAEGQQNALERSGGGLDAVNSEATSRAFCRKPRIANATASIRSF